LVACCGTALYPSIHLIILISLCLKLLGAVVPREMCIVVV
jgi:hypothetical protein